jgi:DNA-binding HxlR family transcriptional regulator
MTEHAGGPGAGRREEDDQATARPGSGDQPASGVDWGRVGEVLDAVNGQWALPVLRTLASGVSRPGDQLRAINAESGGRLSPKVMFDTLGRLVQDGLISRTEVEGVVPREVHYWPTREGHAVLDDLSRVGEPDETRGWRPAMGYEDPPAPPGVDITVPSPARVWNALLGGKDNFAADRAAVRDIVALMPSMPAAARLTRRFQADAVQRLVEDWGVRQFIDIGTGLPVAGAVHETAQRLAPESRVVYVDNDPMVLAHGRALLRSSHGSTALVEADIRQPGKILAHASRTLDLEQPVAVTMLMILHFIPDSDDPWGIVRRLLDGIPGGSWLVMSHVGADIAPETPETTAKYNARSPVPVRPRSSGEITRFFTEAGATLLSPGLVPLARWWPAEELPTHESNAHVGIGRRPARRGQATA